MCIALKKQYYSIVMSHDINTEWITQGLPVANLFHVFIQLIEQSVAKSTVF